MSYQDERDKLRKEAEADTQAAQVRSEHQKAQKMRQQEMLAERQAQQTQREVRHTEAEMGRIEDRLAGMERAERRVRRELGIKAGSKKRSDVKRIKEEAGTLHKKDREVRRLEELKKNLGNMQGGSAEGGPALRPPGGGLIR